MSNFKLNLPQDLPWKRVCVSEDMVDDAACDDNFPPKWHSSLAVFKFIPDEEFQLYPDYKITYLKVTATITGYQPIDDEIQGEINWDGLNIETKEGLTELLTSYHPCNGAILQVVVGPKNRKHNTPKDKLPFFMDFEPKKRELYELATDTKEKQSRSIETLNVTKSAGNTSSQEIMDIDMGGGGFGMNASYAGTGGGFTTQDAKGQWGTKQLNSQESMESRSADSGQEKRESYSFTTTISQMYNQLNSYHIGTNRSVFFIQPRPHVLEQPSGFVKGPRPVEGIQEFFMVVAQPKDEDDFCISLRLDTAHLTEEDILDYDYRTDTSPLASAEPTLPTKNDIPSGSHPLVEACAPPFGWPCWDVNYHCYRTTDSDDQIYTAPSGFIISGFANLINESSHGSTSAIIAAGSKSLTLHAEATAERCFEGSEVCADCPDTLTRWTGYARRRVQVNLRSEIPTRKIGTRQVLLITTRGICCCLKEGNIKIPGGVNIIGVKRIPDYFEGTIRQNTRQINFESPMGTPQQLWHEKAINYSASDETVTQTKTKVSDTEDHACNCNNLSQGIKTPFDRQMPIRKANEMIGFIRDEMLKSIADPRKENSAKPFFETDFFAQKMQAYLGTFKSGKSNLNRKVDKNLPKPISRRLEQKFAKKIDDVNVFELLTLSNFELGELGKMNPKEVTRFKLSQLGILLVNPKPPKPNKPDKPTRRN